MITLGEIAEWILKNRRKTAFINYTIETILDELVRCSNDRTMLCVFEDDTIVGVVTAKVNSECNTMYVYNILTTKTGVIRKMLEWFRENYPNHMLEARRRGTTHKKYTNVDKLINKL